MEREDSKTQPFVKRFKISLEELSPEEKSLSDHLVNIAHDIAAIYGLQQNDQYPGANFYPHDATREDIEEAAKDNPDILSEYTVVLKDPEGRIIPHPYHLAFQEFLEPISEKLEIASTMTSDSNLSQYLKLRSQSLLDGDYEKSESFWLSIPEPVVDIVIGPYDRYIDNLFGRKYAYLSWTGTLEVAGTARAQKFINGFLEAYGWQGSPIRARVDNTRIFAGLASIGWSANNLPCQSKWRERHGSKITIFLPSFRERFERRLESLNSIWPQSREFAQDYLQAVSRIFLFAHESCHPLIRRDGDELRLKSQYSIISELYCDLLGIVNSRKLIGKELNLHEWQLLFPTFIAWGLARFKEVQSPSALSAYLIGEAAALNFFISNGSVVIDNEKLRIASEDKLEGGLNEIISILEHLMTEGTETEAANFINKFGKIEKFAEFKN